MERLTEKHWKNLDPWECCGQDRFCGRRSDDLGGCRNGCIVPKLYARLAAYEDIGLEPEKIKALVTEHEAAIADIYHMGGCPNCKKNLGRSERTGLPVCADEREYPNGICFVWRGHTPNDPLTLEELMEMDGEPVWIEPIGNRYQRAEWGIVHLCPPPNIADPQVIRVLTGIISFEQSLPYSKKKRNQRYGKSWLAYRRKPEEGTP